jgi:hypothetical protein
MSFGSIASFQPIASYFRSTPNNRDIGDAPTLRDDTSPRTDSLDGQNLFDFSGDRFGRRAFSLPKRVRAKTNFAS